MLAFGLAIAVGALPTAARARAQRVYATGLSLVGHDANIKVAG